MLENRYDLKKLLLWNRNWNRTETGTDKSNTFEFRFDKKKKKYSYYFGKLVFNTLNESSRAILIVHPRIYCDHRDYHKPTISRVYHG